jgi:hypothetical protein
MNENMVDECDEVRAQKDELIRAYQLAQAKEWAEYEGKYGWIRQLDPRAGVACDAG